MEKIANTKRERKVFKSRIMIASLFMIAMTFILVLRLFNLQITKYEYYLRVTWKSNAESSYYSNTRKYT